MRIGRLAGIYLETGLPISNTWFTDIYLETGGLPIRRRGAADTWFTNIYSLPISNTWFTDIHRETGGAACTWFTDIYLETGGAACTSVTDIYRETDGAACIPISIKKLTELHTLGLPISIEKLAELHTLGSYQALTVVEGYFHACASGASPISRNWRSCLHVVAATLLLKKLAERAASVSSRTFVLAQQAQ